ncbi:MAG: right-handed parallel beta-helix repeat-containing protein, partial [Armatimonadetes bacterium]|nr:right-handed parallel beta-helix repeat-containing protein [Armatimonadota bacterium]
MRNGKAYRGGGIYCGYSSPIISNNTIMGNSATSSTPTCGGGGICCPSSSPTISNNTITGNSAYSGSGIHCLSSSPIISNNTICANSALGYGGGIYCDDSSPTISNNTITGNSASGDGGGIYSFRDSSPTISNNTIAANSVSRYGGGIHCEYCSCTISRNTITENSAQFGGGIFCWHSSSFMSNNTIARNSATAEGGGICCHFRSSSTISNNTITANSAPKGGGIYCSFHSLPTISSNSIIANSARNGGGIFCDASWPVISNNTIAENSACDGGGIYCNYYESTPFISNNIVAFNSSGIYRSDGSPTLLNNCVYNPGSYNYSGLSPGTGDIQVDPKLCGIEYGNVHIKPDSPCIDAGDSSVVQPDWVDIDGQPRIQGARVDIGADESDGTAYEPVPLVVRVSTSGSDSNDGSSWSSAKRSVQSAIDTVYAAGGGEVWVAAGTYVERITLRNFVHVYGGFAGSEASKYRRNWTANVTILDGNQGGSVVTASYLAYRTARIDGFTIRNGKSDYGGGIYCDYS